MRSQQKNQNVRTEKRNRNGGFIFITLQLYCRRPYSSSYVLRLYYLILVKVETSEKKSVPSVESTKCELSDWLECAAASCRFVHSVVVPLIGA